MRKSTKLIKLIVLDVDGTMTDGGIYIDSNGVETKKFSIKDGTGIRLAEEVGIEFMVLTGRESVCVDLRAKELYISHIYQGIHNKVTFLKKYMADNEILSDEVAYIGDDLNDLPSMRIVGYCACPSDAVNDVKDFCDITLTAKGGEGAIREFVELILKERELWEFACERLFSQE